MAFAVELKPGPAFARFNKEMHFGIMPERFKMAVSRHSRRYRFFVQDLRLAKCDSETKALLDELLQHFQLDQPHDAYMNLLHAFVPNHIQGRVFRVQNVKSAKHLLYMDGIVKLHF
ncbi:hypothetical protein D3C71_1811950 [compost metagenome]